MVVVRIANHPGLKPGLPLATPEAANPTCAPFGLRPLGTYRVFDIEGREVSPERSPRSVFGLWFYLLRLGLARRMRGIKR